MTVTSLNSCAKSRLKHHRTETIRPFIQKYQYRQLTLPEPQPESEKAPDDLELPLETAELESRE